jgi:hypothetical protein
VTSAANESIQTTQQGFTEHLDEFLLFRITHDVAQQQKQQEAEPAPTFQLTERPAQHVE